MSDDFMDIFFGTSALVVFNLLSSVSAWCEAVVILEAKIPEAPWQAVSKMSIASSHLPTVPMLGGSGG